MNETYTVRSVAIKTLAIIGFLVTVALIVFFAVKGLARLPEAFSSLASLAESVQNYRPVREITLTPEKTVVNSGEPFRVTWTDAKQEGEYTFSFECTDSIKLEARNENNEMVAIDCTDEIVLPHTVHELFLNITSEQMRFIEVPLYLSFINDEADVALDTETHVAVLNARIPEDSEDGDQEPPVVVVPPSQGTTTPPSPQPTTPRPAAPVQPVYTIVYPESDPNGYVDLRVTILGSGVLDGDRFVYAAAYDEDERNALRFDIKNIGTKTSGEWTFKTILPSGEIYESREQRPLKPSERAEFTLGFGVEHDDDFAKITTTVDTRNDINSANDKSVWYVTIVE